MRRGPWRGSFPDFPDLMTRFSRFKLSARLCNLRLNPDAAQPLARLMLQTYIQIFQTQTLDATLQFGSKSGCSIAHVQTFQTLCPDFPDSNPWREYAICFKIWMRRDPWRDSCSRLIFRFSRLKLSTRLCNLGLNPDAA